MKKKTELYYKKKSKEKNRKLRLGKVYSEFLCIQVKIKNQQAYLAYESLSATHMRYFSEMLRNKSHVNLYLQNVLVVPPYLWFCFLQFQLPLVNCGLTILNKKFQR